MTPRDGFATLAWTPVDGATDYQIERTPVDAANTATGPAVLTGLWRPNRQVRQERPTFADAGFNPIGYHLGTVWPHDNSIIVDGLARYGFRDEANRVALALLEAAGFLEFRLPEAFSGFGRDIGRFPVPYPTACSPQAWSTGTPLLLLRTMLGLDTSGRFLVSDPALPADINYLALLDIPGRWGRIDAFGRGRSFGNGRRPVTATR